VYSLRVRVDCVCLNETTIYKVALKSSNIVMYSIHDDEVNWNLMWLLILMFYRGIIDGFYYS
jgi:hypothetical protein